MISLNSEVEFNPFFTEEYKKRMIDWLINDLSISNKKWKIVYMHRPLYCSKPNEDCSTQSEVLKNLFESIFIKYSVDLVISGHRHNYER
jgi:hypothetical protein